jgi:hypothetical protein
MSRDEYYDDTPAAPPPADPIGASIDEMVRQHRQLQTEHEALRALYVAAVSERASLRVLAGRAEQLVTDGFSRNGGRSVIDGEIAREWLADFRAHLGRWAT